ncbi:MAG: hypothetical protein E7573_08330 [Ruminococcaceae bacterium]|nr:hypothetical protein [Oscillospiraceae bacterium]MBR3595501.1 hypothetical protein [Clostridia bacterium]
MNNDDFLDILGELDNDIISDAVFEKKKNNHGIVKKIITVSAAVLVFVLSGFIIKEEFIDSSHVLPTEEPTTEENIQTIVENTTEEYTSDKPSYENISENLTDNEYEEHISSSEVHSHQEETEPDSTQFIYEPSSDENTTQDGNYIQNEPVFITADISELLSGDTASVPEDFTNIEMVGIDKLKNLYGTKILPSYLPVIESNSILDNTHSEKYIVCYNEDKTEFFCKNYFSFILKNGCHFSVKASTEELPMLETEKKHVSDISYINETPLLLFEGKEMGIPVLYSAYIRKDGCFFRIQMSGLFPDKKEFIRIISSFI